MNSPDSFFSEIPDEIATLVKSAKAFHSKYFDTGREDSLKLATATWTCILEHQLFEEVNTKNKMFIRNDAASSFFYLYQNNLESGALLKSKNLWETCLSSIEESHPRYSSVLVNLCNVYIEKGLQNELLLAKELCQKALNIFGENSSPRAFALHASLGLMDLKCYELGMGIIFLESGIDNLALSIENGQIKSTRQAMRQDNLANALKTRFELFGDIHDLERAETLTEFLLQMVSPPSPHWIAFQNNLSIFKALRFKYYGKSDDLHSAIIISKDSLKHVSISGKFGVPILNNLGNLYRERFARTKSRKDIDHSIDSLTQAIKVADQKKMATLQGNLAHSLLERALEFDDPQSLATSQNLAQKASNSNLKGLPRISLLIALANSYGESFSRRKQEKDLVQAVSLYRQALQQTPPGALIRPVILRNLASSLEELAKIGLASFSEAQATYLKAMRLGEICAPEQALAAGRNLVLLLFKNKDWQGVGDTYDKLLPIETRLIRLQWLRRDKEDWLKDCQSMATLAAYAKAKQGLLAESVLILEQSLTRLGFDQIFQLRLRFQQLRYSHEEIYRRIVETMVLLQQLNLAQVWSAEQAQKSTECHALLEALLLEAGLSLEEERLPIKAYVNFFSETPLVYFASTLDGGFAIVIHNEISIHWLPRITTKFLDHKVLRTRHIQEGKTYINLQKQWLEDNLDDEGLKDWEGELKRICKRLFSDVMKEVLGSLIGHRKVYFVPVGILGILPFHGAENDCSEGRTKYVNDKTALAYLPNARCAMHTFHQEIKKSMIVLAPGEKYKKLPYAPLEARILAGNMPNSILLEERTANAEKVLEHLKSAQVFHFVGHAETFLSHPLDNCLILQNKQTLSLKDLLTRKLNSMTLVALPACATGMIGFRLPEEHISLSTSLVLGPAKGVLATLWPVADRSCLFMMLYFYCIWPHRESDPALALQKTQVWLREATANKLRAFLDSYLEDSNLEFGTEDRIAISHLKTFLLLKGRSRPFSNPIYWAAMFYMGR